MKIPLFSPVLLLALPLVACAGGEAHPQGRPVPMTTTRIHSDHATEFKPTLHLSPKTVTLTQGATHSFSAEINYEPDGPRYMRQPVTWTVMEAGGGSITHAGVYTAPDKPGIYHVKAEREDHRGVSDTATVTVMAATKP